MTLTVVTPWLDHAELIPAYEDAVRDADEVVIIDNASTPGAAAEIMGMLRRLGYPDRHRYIRNPVNRWFTAATNQGLAVATGHIALCLNNDVRGDAGWLERVRRDVQPDGVYGPGVQTRLVAGVTVPYVEGWCLAATRGTWSALGGFDEAAYPKPYWEDVDLSFRAARLGMGLWRARWMVEHLSNTTSHVTPGAYDHSDANRATLEARVKTHLEGRPHAAEARVAA